MPIQLVCSYELGDSLPPAPFYRREGVAQARPGCALPRRVLSGWGVVDGVVGVVVLVVFGLRGGVGSVVHEGGFSLFCGQLEVSGGDIVSRDTCGSGRVGVQVSFAWSLYAGVAHRGGKGGAIFLEGGRRASRVGAEPFPGGRGDPSPPRSSRGGRAGRGGQCDLLSLSKQTLPPPSGI